MSLYTSTLWNIYVVVQLREYFYRQRMVLIRDISRDMYKHVPLLCVLYFLGHSGVSAVPANHSVGH